MGDKMKWLGANVLMGLKHLCRIAVTMLVGMLVSLLMAAYVIPIVGALLVTNAGVTPDMSMVTVQVTVLIPELFVVGVAIALTIWVTRGVWRLLTPRDTKREGEAQ